MSILCYHIICLSNDGPMHCSGADYTINLVRDFISDLLPIADAICCICDLLPNKNHFLSFFAPNRGCDLVCDSVSRTKSHRKSKHDIAWWQFRVRHQIADTPNCICDTQQIWNEIAHEIACVTRPSARIPTCLGSKEMSNY
jgi:hypothetical protein